MPATRECVFCATPITNSTASREDTIPKWLQAELGIADATVEPTLTSWTGEQLSQRVHPVGKLVTGGVCRRCNNGWMSELESEAIPILRVLMSSKQTLESLDRSERRDLSRWSQKTAFMLDRGGLEPHVAEVDLHEFYENAPYPLSTTFVFGRQQLATRPWYYIATGTWKHGQLTDAARERVERDSYKISLQFRDLILFIAHWPLARWGFRVEKGELVKIWPENAVVKEYLHPETQNATLSDDACRRYLLTLSVVPHAGAVGYARR